MTVEESFAAFIELLFHIFSWKENNFLDDLNGLCKHDHTIAKLYRNDYTGQ